MSTFYKSEWETLRFCPWFQIRTVVAETGFGLSIAAWNEYRLAPRKAGAR